MFRYALGPAHELREVQSLVAGLAGAIEFPAPDVTRAIGEAAAPVGCTRCPLLVQEAVDCRAREYTARHRDFAPEHLPQRADRAARALLLLHRGRKPGRA